MEKYPIIAHTLGGLSINDLEKFASAARPKTASSIQPLH